MQNIIFDTYNFFENNFGFLLTKIQMKLFKKHEVSGNEKSSDSQRKVVADEQKFDQLKEHQRIKIAEWLYEAYKELRVEQNRVPNGEDDAKIIGAVMKKISDAEIWIPEHEVEMYHKGKKNRYDKRFEAESNL